MPNIIDMLLLKSIQHGASDIHLKTNSVPKCRIDGGIKPVPGFEERVFSKGEVEQILKYIIPDSKWAQYEQTHEMDLAYALNEQSRFRVNAFQQRENPGAVLRLIPTTIPTLQQLGMPPVLTELSHKPKGLILVTGPTGSGKSTTLAAMIDSINASREEHIMTIEDPIEFTHEDKKSIINQREIGRDTDSFSEALKRVLRQDPDVILVGELRDPETISIALTAAETGHLVFGTLHTQSAAKTINRIVDSFPAAQQPQVIAQLSDTLEAVISQTLLKKLGGGRVAATEIMVRTGAIANMIREGDIPQIYSAIQTGSRNGMHTLDQDLIKLIQSGQISKEAARPHMITPETLDKLQDVGGWQ